MNYPMELIDYIQNYRKALHYIGKYKSNSKMFNEELNRVLDYEESYNNLTLYTDNQYYYIEEDRVTEYYYYKLDKMPISSYTIETIKMLELLVKEFKVTNKTIAKCEICEKEMNLLQEGKNIKETLAIFANGRRCRQCFNKEKPRPKNTTFGYYGAIYGNKDWSQDEVITEKRKRRGRPRKVKASDYVEKCDVLA